MKTRHIGGRVDLPIELIQMIEGATKTTNFLLQKNVKY